MISNEATHDLVGSTDRRATKKSPENRLGFHLLLPLGGGRGRIDCARFREDKRETKRNKKRQELMGCWIAVVWFNSIGSGQVSWDAWVVSRVGGRICIARDIHI